MNVPARQGDCQERLNRPAALCGRRSAAIGKISSGFGGREPTDARGRRRAQARLRRVQRRLLEAHDHHRIAVPQHERVPAGRHRAHRQVQRRDQQLAARCASVRLTFDVAQHARTGHLNQDACGPLRRPGRSRSASRARPDTSDGRRARGRCTARRRPAPASCPRAGSSPPIDTTVPSGCRSSSLKSSIGDGQVRRAVADQLRHLGAAAAHDHAPRRPDQRDAGHRGERAGQAAVDHPQHDRTSSSDLRPPHRPSGRSRTRASRTSRSSRPAAAAAASARRPPDRPAAASNDAVAGGVPASFPGSILPRNGKPKTSGPGGRQLLAGRPAPSHFFTSARERP